MFTPSNNSNLCITLGVAIKISTPSNISDFSNSITATGAKGFTFRWTDNADPLTFGEYLKITVNVNQLTGEANWQENKELMDLFNKLGIITARLRDAHSPLAQDLNDPDGLFISFDFLFQ